MIWLEEETRTWGELKGEWKAWCMVEVNDFPIKGDGFWGSRRDREIQGKIGLPLALLKKCGKLKAISIEGNQMFKFNEDPAATELNKDFIKLVKEHDACEEAVIWLEEEPRTWGELRSDWKVWCMVEVKDFPIDLRGVNSWGRARVMRRRKDIPIDLTGMGSGDRALVMADRADCVIDLTGMSPGGRAWVMIKRKDCPIDFTGMGSGDRARVMANRKDCVIDFTGMDSWERALVMAKRRPNSTPTS